MESAAHINMVENRNFTFDTFWGRITEISQSGYREIGGHDAFAIDLNWSYNWR